MGAVEVACIAWHDAITEERRLLKLRNACRCIHEGPAFGDMEPPESGGLIAVSTFAQPCWKSTRRHVPPEGDEVEDYSDCCPPCLERVRLHKSYKAAHQRSGRLHAQMSRTCLWWKKHNRAARASAIETGASA